jgi:diguanylate cyclase (GGDEF)-like protein
MTSRTRNILFNSAIVTLIAVAASTVLSVAMHWGANIAADWLDWTASLVIPILISVPIAWYVFSGNEDLKTAHARLDRLHKDLSKAHDRLTFICRHDHLTGLLSREGFMSDLEQGHNRGASNVVLIVDADHFKQVNDKYGHQVGDEALVKIARALQYVVRRADFVGRIGGEEFAVFLGSVDQVEGARIANLIRRQVQCIPWHEPSGLTVSIGGAVMERRSKVADVLRQADHCLYEAKRLGRNRVVFDCAASAAA